jgi:hypothetical protein
MQEERRKESHPRGVRGGERLPGGLSAPAAHLGVCLMHSSELLCLVFAMAMAFCSHKADVGVMAVISAIIAAAGRQAGSSNEDTRL